MSSSKRAECARGTRDRQRDDSNDQYTLRSKENHQRTTENLRSSPMKRNNQSLVEESPKKRLKMPDLRHAATVAAAACSPRKVRALSLTEATNNGISGDAVKSTLASTPKSERRVHTTRVKELIANKSASVERSMSSNWGDILEELEEQTKELDTFIGKVATKYNIDKEKIAKTLETDAETLRKRQKKINMGKITAEYSRYILAVPRKERQPYHPKTPNKYRKCSRRKFDGHIKKWRILLHAWDENPEGLKDYKHSMDFEELDKDELNDLTGGGVSNITDSLSLCIDDYDITDCE